MQSRNFGAFSRALFLFVALWLTVSGAGAQTPQLSAVIGSGANISYFVLDLKDPAITAPRAFAFGYRYDGAKTGGDMLDALTAQVPTFQSTLSTFPGFGRFVSRLGYQGKTRDSSPPNPNAYWSYWLSVNGANWDEAQVGLDSRPLTNGSWDGWAWVQDFNNGPAAPPTSVFASAVAPEPASLSLLALGMAGLISPALSRKRARKNG